MERESQTVQVLPQLASLNRVVLDVIDLYQPAFALKRLASGLDLDPALPLTWIDTPQLERGLANLLRSEVRYTSDGDLIFCRTETDGDWVQLMIGDTSQQADVNPAQDAVSAATGAASDALGLAVSRAIVAAHGGEMTLDPSCSSGARFLVRLPSLVFENAQLMAELGRDNRSQYEFLTKLSYELRSPLNVIMGYTGLMLDAAFGTLTSEQAYALQRMEQCAIDLLGPVDSMLAKHSGDSSEPRGLRAPRGNGGDRPEGLAEGGRRTRSRVELALLARENAKLMEELRKARRAESEFVTATSHQLRVPLNAIIGYNDLLLDEEFGGLTLEQTGVLQRVRRSTLGLLESINCNLEMRRVTDVAHASATSAESPA
jgi:signal transduction histidine kinase